MASHTHIEERGVEDEEHKVRQGACVSLCTFCTRKASKLRTALPARIEERGVEVEEREVCRGATDLEFEDVPAAEEMKVLSWQEHILHMLPYTHTIHTHTHT
jgi:hypothetical protein